MDTTVTQVGDVTVHHAERGSGTPVVVLHGMGVDHREPAAALEPVLGARHGYRRLYPDLPGMGATTAPAGIASSDDVVSLLADWLDVTVGEEPVLLVGHSYGGYLARVLAGRRAPRVAGLALLCPAGARSRDVPTPVVRHAEVGADDGMDPADAASFRDYFVVRTPATRRRFDETVRPAADLLDRPALERIASRWELDETDAGPIDVPVLVVAGRQDSSVGYASAWDLVERYSRATFAVLDRAGHALPHEQQRLLAALVDEWLDRVEEHRGRP
ncbi:2-hydroxy-6-oxo-6-phenylhexa-2,4-dienoate hydrolase [Cellulomonas chitinilytica]|uniref:2-hydroxy-6-oxo-6-phenylhexa-2,4-dienoate hydrolase n=1 Tax=Cellulomonas chitinilytica TaxID=398759 RepID=A0A919P460_9CELL|nr:alpha/beta hydrolase [Cellulomonas chitinilytica]GIG21064.1 2-hydroxy-6-oxo-6-phenylhexa-2,4-dienoate hydrolase [Cellulomonas chitinilytica]